MQKQANMLWTWVLVRPYTNLIWILIPRLILELIPLYTCTTRVFILKGKANNKLEIQKLATIWNLKLKIGNNIKHWQKIGYFRNLKGDFSPNNKDTTQCNKICTYQNTKQKWTPSKVRTKCKCDDKLDSCTILHINL